MSDPVLLVDGTEVARYRVTDLGDIAPDLGRRPFLHPVRTLAGTPVTDTEPADHRWHLGLSVTVPDIDGNNFWGGPSYRAGEGYRDRADHGEIRHRTWRQRTTDAVEHDLDWIAHTGEVLLDERRRIGATPAPGGWALTITTRLTNATDRSLRLEGPGSMGRTGAGYGGIFWRLPEGPVQVDGPGRSGEDTLNGADAEWLRVRTSTAELLLRGTGDPWFVRTSAYPGVGTAFCATAPLELTAGAGVHRSLDAVVRDRP